MVSVDGVAMSVEVHVSWDEPLELSPSSLATCEMVAPAWSVAAILRVAIENVRQGKLFVCLKTMDENAERGTELRILVRKDIVIADLFHGNGIQIAVTDG